MSYREFVSGAAALVALIALCGCSDSHGAARATTAVTLVRAEPAIVRAACREAQRHTHRRVTCPTLVPRTRYVRDEGLWGELDTTPSVWAITFNNGDNGVGYVHWIAGAGAASTVRSYFLGDARNEVKGLPRLVSHSIVRRHVVSVYHYPRYPAGGPNGGHSAAFVQCGTSTVFSSIHGYGHETAATLMALDLAKRSGCR